MNQDFYLPPVDTPFMELQKPLVFFDLETTGANPKTDRIVELCAIKLLPDGRREELHYLVNPGMPIPPGATAVHNITDDMVKDQPLFEQLAPVLAPFFTACDLGGYNIRRFDVPLLMEEFHRARLYPINFNEVKMVDVMGIYHQKEKRDLSAAVRFYCEREHEGAHSAKADVLATIDILKHQLLRYEDLAPNTSFLHDYLSAGKIVDIGGKFSRDENGEIIFNFGKHIGKPACSEPDYLKWMYKDGDFLVNTKMVAKKIWVSCMYEKEIRHWLEGLKILENAAVASSLYTTLKFGNDVFPFALGQKEGKQMITYLNEPTSSYSFASKDAQQLMIQILEQSLAAPAA